MAFKNGDCTRWQRKAAWLVLERQGTQGAGPALNLFRPQGLYWEDPF